MTRYQCCVLHHQGPDPETVVYAVLLDLFNVYIPWYTYDAVGEQHIASYHTYHACTKHFCIERNFYYSISPIPAYTLDRDIIAGKIFACKFSHSLNFIARP